MNKDGRSVTLFLMLQKLLGRRSGWLAKHATPKTAVCFLKTIKVHIAWSCTHGEKRMRSGGSPGAVRRWRGGGSNRAQEDTGLLDRATANTGFFQL